LLDEVLFVVRTDARKDLVWLGDLVDSVPEYSKTFAVKGRYGDYTDAWKVVQNGVLYVKIDDDVVRSAFLNAQKMLTPTGLLRR
jgi:hypothetical protein